MKTGFVFFILFPIFLEGCCVRNHRKKKTGFYQDSTHQYYRAVEGEIMMMPCVKSSNQLWFKTEGGEENKHSQLDCMMTFLAEAKHSGNYTSAPSKQFLQLQVLGKHSARCFERGKSSVALIVAAGGKILCPAFFCGGNNTDVIWYKGNRAVCELQRFSCENEALLHLKVSEFDTGLYFCDRLISEKGVSWILRRAVNVTAIPFERARNPPRIPDGNKTEEVELGLPYTLTCIVYFDFELEFSPRVQWYVNYDGKRDNVILQMDTPQQKLVKAAEYEVTQNAIIEKVTPAHLNHTYTCIASNTVGNNSVTIKLERKNKVKWPSLVGYPIISLLLLVGLGVMLHVKWLEIHLILKSYFKYGIRDKDEKDFSIFLSYVWTPSSDLVETSTFPSRSGLSKEEEALFPGMDLLSTEKSEASQMPLQVLLPHVLEEEWAYRLCLLERDVLPGGAYTNDVVLAIKRSQMLICILSAEYLTNTNAVFVLESGIQALLQRSSFKLLLIWTDRSSTSLIQPDPPLPKLVRRALRVLPSLDWSSDHHATGNRNFWKSVRNNLPVKEGDATHNYITPRTL